MRTLWQDLRFGVRMLLKKPSYTLVAVLTLSLGIGSTTAIFSVVDAVLLRPLPYRDAEQLVVPVSLSPSRGVDDGSVSYADQLDWEREQIFEEVAVIGNVTSGVGLSGGKGE